MKKTSYRKEATLLVTIVTTILLFSSCGYNQRSDDSKDVAEDRNEERFDDNKHENDAQFLVNAAEINMEQIRLGQLAQQKGNTAQVKELGKMMEDAHTKSQRELTALANRKSITVPTSPTDDVRDAYEDLNEKSGDDFDKAYADMMVSKHEDAIDTFEEVSTDSGDTDIKNWATANLSVLRTNLNHSKEVQKKSDELYSQQ